MNNEDEIHGEGKHQAGRNYQRRTKALVEDERVEEAAREAKDAIEDEDEDEDEAPALDRPRACTRGAEA